MKLAVYAPNGANAPDTPDRAGAPDATDTADASLTASDIEAALADRAVEIEIVDDAAAADLAVAVAVDGLRSAATAEASPPVLSVGIDAPWCLPAELGAVADAVARIADASVAAVPTASHRSLRVAVDGETTTAVADCTLLTTQPARISEYAVAAGGTPLTEFRADGVVVATPVGSGSYARAAGGPRVTLDGGVAVVPIAPFATQADDWVVAPPLSLSVERDTAVTVFADDRAVATGTTGLAVEVREGPSLSLVDARGLGEAGGNWKNSNESLPEE